MSNIDELINNLIHPDRRVSDDAKKAILSLGQDAIAPLLQALPLADPKLCWKIIDMLGKICDPRAIPAVSGYLFVDNSVIRAAAAQCLGEIGDQQATVPLLTALQENKHSGALVWIVQALGRLADDRAVNALLIVMQETESSAVRYTAIEALGLIGDRCAIEPIKQYLNDTSGHVRSRVEIALGRLGDEQTQTVSGLIGTDFSLA